MKSKLPNSVLRRIWNLSDIDEDGMLDRDEFAVAMFLIDHKLSGNDIPDVLPDRLVPPSKLQRYTMRHREEEQRGRYGERDDHSLHSNDFNGGSAASREASYAHDSRYGGEGGEGRGGERGGGRGYGRYEEDTSYGERQSSSRRRQSDDYDNDPTHLSSFIDRGQ